MKRKAVVLAAVLALGAGLAACGTATPYQPNVAGQSPSGGFSEIRLEPERFRVTFAGNSLTSRETVEGYLLYRAAELTTQQGYDWFEMVVRDTERKSRTHIDSMYSPWWGPGYGYWGWRPYWRYYGGGYGWRTWDPYWGDPFWGDRYDVHTIDKYEASAEILLHRGAKPADNPQAFDARAVMENLGPRIQRPVPKS